jgi:uncharacterized membrane protein
LSLGSEALYQVFFFVIFFIFYYVSPAILYRGNLGRFQIILLGFFALSLFIHVFLWEEVAYRFYSKDADFGGLRLVGTIPRFYSLLLNPLTIAFSCVLILALLMLLGNRNHVLQFLLSVMVLLALSRLAIVCLTLLWLGYAVNYKRYGLLALLFGALTVAITAVEPIRELALETLSGNDQTGSASEHFRNIFIGSQYVFDFFSVNGFIDARHVGGWHIRLESTPFQFAFTSGFYPFFLFVLIFLFSSLHIVKRFGLFGGYAIGCVLPIFLFFPVHTFNYSVFLYAILLNSWQFQLPTALVATRSNDEVQKESRAIVKREHHAI